MVTSSSSLEIDGYRANDWVFEESLLDQEHCVCTAILGTKDTNTDIDKLSVNYKTFEQIDTIESILDRVKFHHERDMAESEEWEIVMKMQKVKPF